MKAIENSLHHPLPRIHDKYIYLLVVCSFFMVIAPGLALAQLRGTLFATNEYTTFDIGVENIGESMTYAGAMFGSEIPYLAVGDPDARGGGAVWLVPLEEGRSSESEPILISSASDKLSLATGDLFGKSIAILEDLNGDGIPELAVGAPGDDEAGENAGAVWILFLDEKGTLANAYKITEGKSGWPYFMQGGEELGFAVAGVTGLVRGSGRSMLVAGAPGSADERGRFFYCVIDQDGIESCDGNAYGFEFGGRLGSAIVQFGEIDENGRIPVAISEPGYPNEEGKAIGRIQSHLLRIDENGEVSLFFVEYIVPVDVDGGSFGTSLAAPGDVNRDGLPDLLIGASEQRLNSKTRSGSGYLALMHVYQGVALDDLTIIDFNQGKVGFNATTAEDRYGASMTVIPRPNTLPLVLIGIPGDDQFSVDGGAIQLLSFYDPFPAVALDDHVTVLEDSSTEIFVLDNDLPEAADKIGMFLSLIDGGTISGSISGLTGRSHTIAPAPDFNGTLRMRYLARINNDGIAAGFTQAVLTLEVTPVEDLPRISDLAAVMVPVDSLFDENVEVREVDGDPLSTSVIKKPDWLAVVVDGDTLVTLIGTPAENDIGPHEVILRAEDGKGATNKSFIITVPSEMLAIPELLSPAPNATNQPFDVTLSWLPVNAATRYLVHVAADEAFSSIQLTATVTAASHEFTGLMPATTYYWRVQAVNDNAGSPFSQVFSFTTEPAPVEPLAAPLLLIPADGSAEQEFSPTLIWQPSVSATLYQVQVATDISFVELLVDAPVENPSLQLEDLAPGTTYYWRVQAVRDSVSGAFSQPFGFTTALGVGVESSTLPTQTRLLQNYPNPFSRQTRIGYELADPGHVRLTVYDLLGREVAVLVDGAEPAGSHEAVFNAGALPSGMYIYRLTTRATSMSHQLVVMQ